MTLTEHTEKKLIKLLKNEFRSVLLADSARNKFLAAAWPRCDLGDFWVKYFRFREEG